MVLTQQAVADIHGDDKGLASGGFETANHLIGGGIGVALHAPVLTAVASTPHNPGGYRTAFLTAAALAVLGLGVTLVSTTRPPITRTADPSVHDIESA